MKTAEQWYSEGGLNNDAAEIQHRREIQADALRSAAKEVREATNFPEDRGALSKAGNDSRRDSRNRDRAAQRKSSGTPPMKTSDCNPDVMAAFPATLGSASRVPLEEIADSFNELHRKLLTGDDLPPRPFWLEIGNSGYRITDENRDNIALGMLLCLDVRGHLGR